MSKKDVYILHKNGADSHYIGLRYLLEKQGFKLQYFEFSVIGRLFKSLFKRDSESFKKQLKNIVFLINLFLTKNKKVVLAIAPFDTKLGRMAWLLRNHQTYYHSSWTCWDQSFQPKAIKSDRVLKQWQNFLEKQVKYHFVVSHIAKSQLLQNYTINPEKISVVHHALKSDFETKITETRSANSFLVIGRLTEGKGIEEILHYFVDHPELKLSMVGSGKLSSKVTAYSEKYGNIDFLDKVTDINYLRSIVAKHEYLILNCKKTTRWEELFGIVLIEALSQGTVPIAAAHSGPKSIVTAENGFLFPEGELTSCLNEVAKGYHNWEALSNKAYVDSKQYYTKEIAKCWEAILN